MVIGLNLQPDNRMLRQFGGLCALVFGGAGLWSAATTGFGARAVILLAVGMGGGFLGLLRPSLLRPVFVGWMVLAFPIGWLVSHLLLGLLFFGVFTPVGLLLRTFGKDSLRLQRGAASSLWQDRAQESDLRRYLRQY
jgi:hypothetical protein